MKKLLTVYPIRRRDQTTKKNKIRTVSSRSMEGRAHLTLPLLPLPKESISFKISAQFCESAVRHLSSSNSLAEAISTGRRLRTTILSANSSLSPSLFCLSSLSHHKRWPFCLRMVPANEWKVAAHTLSACALGTPMVIARSRTSRAP